MPVPSRNSVKGKRRQQCVDRRSNNVTWNAQMKKWTVIALCGLLASAIVIASDRAAPAAADSSTTTAQQHRLPMSSARVDAASSTKPASSTATSPPAAPDSSESVGSLYRVEDGNKVDTETLAGWKTWRALACERCHGAAQEGLVGPSLVDSLKKLSKEEFHTTVMNGRLEKGMPPFSSSKMVSDNWEGFYAYLKGRSDGRIPPGRLSPLDEK